MGLLRGRAGGHICPWSTVGLTEECDPRARSPEGVPPVPQFDEVQVMWRPQGDGFLLFDNRLTAFVLFFELGSDEDPCDDPPLELPLVSSFFDKQATSIPLLSVCAL